MSTITSERGVTLQFPFMNSACWWAVRRLYLWQASVHLQGFTYTFLFLSSFRETGSARTLNMVMLGAAYATNMIPVTLETLEASIRENTPAGTAEMNLKAFKAGMSL